MDELRGRASESAGAFLSSTNHDYAITLWILYRVELVIATVRGHTSSTLANDIICMESRVKNAGTC